MVARNHRSEGYGHAYREMIEALSAGRSRVGGGGATARPVRTDTAAAARAFAVAQALPRFVGSARSQLVRLRSKPVGWVLGRAAVLLGVLVVSGAWIATDHRTPEWDQAYYLDNTLHYLTALHAGGFGALIQQVWTGDPSHPPLFQLSTLPFFLVFGDTPTSALLLSLLVWVVLLLSVGDIAARLLGRRAGLLAMVLTATMPLMVGLSHEVLEDFETTAVVALTVAILLRTDRFSSWRASLALGVVAGLGWLSKSTYPIFVLGPVLVVCAETALAVRDELGHPATRPKARRRAANAAGALAITLLFALGWYIPHLAATVVYIQSASSGPLAVGTGPSNPLTIHNLSAFTLGVIVSAVSLVVACVGLLALAWVAAARLLSRLRRRPTRRGRCGWAVATLLVTWAVIPYLIVATAHNQDSRLLAASLPAVALIVAALVVAVPLWQARWLFSAILCVAGTVLTVGMTWPFTVPVLPSRIAVDTGIGRVYYPISPPAALGYERVPQVTDYMRPVMQYLDAASEVATGAPAVVCVLETDPDINLNTLTYLGDERAASYVFREVRYNGNVGRMHADLLGCDLALYISPFAPDRGEGRRPHILNAGFAQTHMTSADFSIFNGPERSFPIDFGERVEVLSRSR